MDRDEALKLLLGGPEGVKEWNRRREAGEEIPDLSRANLSRANLIGANLSRADLREANLIEANLREAKLGRADLREANLREASLGEAKLSRADLRTTNVSGANLREANLREADLLGADLSEANLNNADLHCADLRVTKLCSADLRGASLVGANLNFAHLDGADLAGAFCLGTVFAGLDLCQVHGLEQFCHRGPSTVGVDTLARSRGRIPEPFLRGCGFAPWQVLVARLHDPTLMADEINDIVYRIFNERTKGPLMVGGVFISYSHADSGFVDQVYERLDQEGVPVWLDRREAVAGSLQRQVFDAMRLTDVVLLVLSEASVHSDWVEHELEMARQKEKTEQRDVLCPVALDAAWKAKLDDVLWRQVKKEYVLDFSAWENPQAFDAQFRKLLKGLKIYYEARPTGQPV